VPKGDGLGAMLGDVVHPATASIIDGQNIRRKELGFLTIDETETEARP
jgi:hypothetical protein